MSSLSATADLPLTASDALPTYRVNIMRAGYAAMGVGLALVKWPLFFQNGGLASLPVYEGVVAALLTAMSLLWFLGLRYPIQLLPLLVFESLWKLIWLAAVGIPHLTAGDMTAQNEECFLQRFVGRDCPPGYSLGLRLEALRAGARSAVALSSSAHPSRHIVASQPWGGQARSIFSMSPGC